MATKVRPPVINVDLDSSGDDIKVIEPYKSTSTYTTSSSSMMFSSSTSTSPGKMTAVTSLPKSSVTIPPYMSSTPVISAATTTTTPSDNTPKIPKSEPGECKPLAPKCLFVRPFEDDYSPVRPESGAAVSPPSRPLVKLELDGRKVEDQDSDYESMSSDSSVKRESLSDSLNKSDSFCLYGEEGRGEEDCPAPLDLQGFALCPTSGKYTH